MVGLQEIAPPTSTTWPVGPDYYPPGSRRPTVVDGITIRSPAGRPRHRARNAVIAGSIASVAVLALVLSLHEGTLLVVATNPSAVPALILIVIDGGKSSSADITPGSAVNLTYNFFEPGSSCSTHHVVEQVWTEGIKREGSSSWPFVCGGQTTYLNFSVGIYNP